MEQGKKVITLSSGQTVTLRDPKTLKVKDRNALMAISDSDLGETTKAINFGEAIVAMMIDDWSFDLIIPSVKKDSLGELTPGEFDEIQEALQDVKEYLFPKLSKDGVVEKDPKAKSANSKG